jgi:6-phosphogluconolactonase
MTKQPSQWTRRAFSKGLAMFTGMASLHRKALAETSFNSLSDGSRFAYVGSAAEGLIHVFDMSGERWRPVQTVSAMQPAHLERHTSLSVLYVIHAVALWENLPRGAVSAYSIDSGSGRLQLINTQPLLLSATSPRHATVTRDGAYLIVAAQDGGSYSLLPIAADGSLMPSESIWKAMGLTDGDTTKAARPRYVLWHPDASSLITADSGNESLHSFNLEGGFLQRRDSAHVHAGAGASQIALSHDGQRIYALNAVNGSLSVHRFHQNSRQIADSPQIFAANRAGAALMTIHPAGHFLVTAGADEDALALTTWDVNHKDGYATLVGAAQQNEALCALSFSPHGEYLFGISRRSGRVIRSSFDPKTGDIVRGQIVAQIDFASCFSLPLA